MWMPMPVASPAARALPWPMLSLWGRALGLILLFVGTLVVVVGATVGGNCFTSATACTGNTSWFAQVANSILTAKILWTIGLFFLAVGASAKLHWGLQAPTSGKTDDVNWVMAERRANYWILTISIILMAILLFTVNVWPPFAAVP
jgi:hypothetical protein